MTGGPSGGKTTAMPIIANAMEAVGWKSICLPEIASIFLGCGVSFKHVSDKLQSAFQEGLLLNMLGMHRLFEQIALEIAATQHKNVLIISDRGPMDPSICNQMNKKTLKKNNQINLSFFYSCFYVCVDVEKKDWLQILAKNGIEETTLRDWADLVLHLQTDPNTYQLSQVRTEPIEDALRLDAALHAAYAASHLIPAQPDFARKMQQCVVEVLQRFTTEAHD